MREMNKDLMSDMQKASYDSLLMFEKAVTALKKRDIPKVGIFSTKYHTDDLYNKLAQYVQPNKEGVNPMGFDTACKAARSATAVSAPSVTFEAQESEASKARRYMFDRLSQVHYQKRSSFYNLFNMNAQRVPYTAKELIDAIKNGKFKLDEKKLNPSEEVLDDEGYESVDAYLKDRGVWYGIEFTDFPKADTKGYEKAKKDLDTEYTKAQDTIAVLETAEGLKALQAFEAWQPEVTAS